MSKTVVLAKTYKTQVILPGESIKYELPYIEEEGEILEIEPRREAPKNFPKHKIR